MTEMGKVKILVVDDDISMCQLYPMYFKKEGYETVVCHDGKAALKLIAEETFSIVLLDVMMPEMDGVETLGHIRKTSKVPVIMVTAKGEKADIIGGLELGADDYVVKPFEMQELISRIKATLRRSQLQESEIQQNISVGNLFVSLSNYVVKVCGKKIPMPPKEIELLHHFVSNPMLVFSRDQLLKKIWREGYSGDTRTVDVHIKRIKEKLANGLLECLPEVRKNTNWRFMTVWGKGYKFEID